MSSDDVSGARRKHRNPFGKFAFRIRGVERRTYLELPGRWIQLPSRRTSSSRAALADIMTLTVATYYYYYQVRASKSIEKSMRLFRSFFRVYRGQTCRDILVYAFARLPHVAAMAETQAEFARRSVRRTQNASGRVGQQQQQQRGSSVQSHMPHTKTRLLQFVSLVLSARKNSEIADPVRTFN